MSAHIDIERLQKALGSKSGRIVIVVPGQEPLIMVPLSDYEQMQISSGKKPPVHKQPEPKAYKSPPSHEHPKSEPPETIDPLPGGLNDDDQYFPEPL